jgi:hypothetical protein
MTSWPVERGSADLLFRTWPALTRLGIQLLATAPSRTTGRGEHGSPDDALLARTASASGWRTPAAPRRDLLRPKSLFTQNRNREAALKDIMKRYAVEPEQCTPAQLEPQIRRTRRSTWGFGTRLRRFDAADAAESLFEGENQASRTR